MLSSSVQPGLNNEYIYTPMLNFFELPTGIIAKQDRFGPKGGPVERYVASVEVVDHQGDVISVSALAEEMETYIKGMGGIFQGIHSNFPAGQVLDWGFCKVANETAIWIDVEFYQFYDSQKDFYKRTKLPWGHEEKISGVSLGGKALERERVCNANGCFTHIKKLEAWEISGVGEPANPLARKILPDNTLEGLGHKVQFMGKTLNEEIESAGEKTSMNTVQKRHRDANGRFVSDVKDCAPCSEATTPIVKEKCPTCENDMDKTFCKHCGSKHGDYSPEVGLKDLSKEEEEEETEKSAAKPDYIDIDGDGNKTESMKDAAEDKEEKKMYMKDEGCEMCKLDDDVEEKMNCHCKEKSEQEAVMRPQETVGERNVYKADSYNDYPKSASNNAKKVLKWKEKYGDEVKGMTSVGWKRARQLANRESLSKETVKRMAQFNRHRQNAKIDPKYKDTPWKDNGYVAWLGWGGTSGVNWAIAKSESFKKGDDMDHDKEEKMRYEDGSEEVKGEEPTRYPETEETGEENMDSKIEELSQKLETMMDAFNIEKFATLVDEKISKNNDELLATIGKGTEAVPNTIVKDGRTYVLKAEEADEEEEEKKMYEKEEDEEMEEVKKAYNEAMASLSKMLESRFVSSPATHPGTQDDAIAKGVDPQNFFQSDLMKSVSDAAHLDKIQHRDSYYTPNYSDDDLEFQDRLNKAKTQTGFDPSVLGLSLPSNNL